MRMSWLLCRGPQTVQKRGSLFRKRILSKNPNIVLVDAEDPVKALENNEIRCIIEIENSYAEKLEDGQPIQITLQYDESKTKSQAAADIVSRAIDKFSEEVVEGKDRCFRSRSGFFTAFAGGAQKPCPNDMGNNMMLQMMLPFVISILVAVGGIPAATDSWQVEGAQYIRAASNDYARRGSLLLGKYLAVTLFSMVSLVAILVGLSIGYIINPNSLTIGIDTQLQGISLDPLAVVLALLITVALGMTFFRNTDGAQYHRKIVRKAQTYLSFLMLAAMVPGYATMFMQASDLSPVMFVMPVLNTVAAFKMILGG